MYLISYNILQYLTNFGAFSNHCSLFYSVPVRIHIMNLFFLLTRQPRITNLFTVTSDIFFCLMHMVS